MPNYLVETYMSWRGADALLEAASRARAAADEISCEGTPVRYLLSIFVPEDETCFFLYEGPSAAAISQVSRRAAIAFERVLKAEARGLGSGSGTDVDRTRHEFS